MGIHGIHRSAQSSGARLARKFVAVVLVCALPVPAGAQNPAAATPAFPNLEPARIRITGAAGYDMPGVIRIERDRVTGNPVRLTGELVQFRAGGDGRLLTVPRPGKQLTGKGRMVDADLLELTVEPSKEPFYVPVSAIARTEVFERQISTGRTLGIVLGSAAAGAMLMLLWMMAAYGD